jgi:hypothetical protein
MKYHVNIDSDHSNFVVSEKMGGVKIRTTHKLSTDVFNSIVKLGSGLKKKKKKGKKVIN